MLPYIGCDLVYDLVVVAGKWFVNLFDPGLLVEKIPDAPEGFDGVLVFDRL